MAKLYVGNLPPGIPEFELEREFARFGRCKVWVARNPPGFGFVEYEDPRDGEDAMRAMDGFMGWRVEFSRGPRGSRGPPPPMPRFFDAPPGFGYRRSPPAYLPAPSYPRYPSPSPRRSRGHDRSYSPDQRRSNRYRSRSRDRLKDRRSRSRGRRDKSNGRRDQRHSPLKKRSSPSRSPEGRRRSSSRGRSNNHSPSPAAEDAVVTAVPGSSSPLAASDDRRSRSPSPYSGASDRSKRSRSPSPP